MLTFFSNLRTKKLCFILFFLAIILPSIILLIENPSFLPDSDELDYNQIAIGLLQGKGFYCEAPVAGIVKMPNSRHPLYPLFIAIIYLFTNNSVIAVKIIQILIHGLTCVVIFYISDNLFENKLTSFFAGIVWALYPLAISQTLVLLSETLFTFLLALSIWFILRNRENPDIKNGFFSGLFLGLTILTKSIILAFIPLLLFWMILFSRNKLFFKFKNLLIIMFFMLLTISPWLFRNYIVLKKFLPIATGSGISFYRYNNEQTLKVINTPLRFAFPFTEEQKKVVSNLPEQEIDKYLYNLARQFIKTHPGVFFKIRLNELFAFWHLWPSSPKRFEEYYLQQKEQGMTNANVLLDRFIERFRNSYLLYFCKILYHLPYDILFLGMLMIFFASFKSNREQWRKSLLLFLLIISVNAVYIFHHGADRYRMPIDPYVFILGLNGVIYIAENTFRQIKQ